MQKGKNGKEDGVDATKTVLSESIERAVIKKKLEDVKKEKENFRLYAEKQMSAFDGAAQALEQLLNPEPKPKLNPVPEPAKDPKDEAALMPIPEDLPKPE